LVGVSTRFFCQADARPCISACTCAPPPANHSACSEPARRSTQIQST
jgi:hypothetical protein